MPHEERDPAHLWDMLEHARLAKEFVHGLSFHMPSIRGVMTRSSSDVRGALDCEEGKAP